MITLRPVSEPTSLPCPACGAPLLSIEPHRHILRGSPLNGDLINMHTLLSRERCIPTGFQCLFDSGAASCCDQRFLMVGAIFVNQHLEPDNRRHSDFINTYFFFNADRGPATSFIASRGKRDWLMERFESDLGPVQQHHLGPLSPRWEPDRAYAERILVALWDDLRALSAASS